MDEELPRKTPDLVLRKLDTLSVAALEAYIGELEAEIARARDEIAKRGNARAAAEAFFS